MESGNTWIGCQNISLELKKEDRSIDEYFVVVNTVIQEYVHIATIS